MYKRNFEDSQLQRQNLTKSDSITFNNCSLLEIRKSGNPVWLSCIAYDVWKTISLRSFFVVFLGFQDCCEWRISFLPFFVGWAVAALQLPYVMLAWWLHFKEHHDVLIWCKLQFSNVAMLSSKQKAQVASSLTPKRRLKVCRDRIGATNV